ncbi:proline-serine-threonine phosphatase interacting protein, partial [Borealophlyctis nickersoniae]
SKETALTKKTSSRGFTKTREDPDDAREDAIITLPPKQGRKKAVERLKQLDKELAEVDKKRTGVETFMGVYKDKPQDPTIQHDLTTQHDALRKRTDSLMFKKHKLSVYISSIDGTAAPPDPTYLTSFSSASSSPLGGGVVESPTVMSDTSSVSAASPGSVKSAASPAVTVGGGSGSVGGGGPRGGVEKARVIYDFEAAPDSQEVSVGAGDVVEVVERQEDGWWRVKVRDGREGYIPGSYTEEV